MAGEEETRRIVGGLTDDSRDPEKNIVEGNQTSLSKLIAEMHAV